MDMSGAAAVLEAVGAIAELGLPLNLLAVVPSTENMPSGHAIKPGDIITQLNGKTVEVNNTDAEGRLILADALAYAVELGRRADRRPGDADRRRPGRARLDLRGADLQRRRARRRGGRGRRAHRRARLAAAAPPGVQGADQGHGRRPHQRRRRSARRARSTPARSSRSSSTGSPWVHLDIAGTAWDVGREYVGKGPTGYGVRLLVELARELAGEELDREQPQQPARQGRVAVELDAAAREPAERRAAAGARGSGTPRRRPPRVGTVAKWTMSGRRPAITRSGLRRSPSSTTTVFGRKAIRSGEKSSAKRKTTRPRIRAASSGSRAMPRSISPKMLGATPSSASFAEADPGAGPAVARRSSHLDRRMRRRDRPSPPGSARS